MSVVHVRPDARKKWRAVLPDGRNVAFGQKGADDFTTHKDPHRMLRYLFRHGGVSSKEYEAAKAWPAAKVTAHFRARTRSSRENWSDPSTAGFWSRWLLWSEPTLAAAARRVHSVTGLRVQVQGSGGSRRTAAGRKGSRRPRSS